LKNFQNYGLWNYYLYVEIITRSIQLHQNSKQLVKTLPKIKGNGSWNKWTSDTCNMYERLSLRVHGYLAKDLLPKRRRKWSNSSVLFSIGSYLYCLPLELLLLLAQHLPMHWEIEISSSKFLMLTDFINNKL